MKCESCGGNHPEGELHNYQELARDFLRNIQRGALFLDMGLGKTAASLRALEPRHFPVLVVAPKKVAESVWDVEKDIWRPDLTIALAVGEPPARAAALAAERDITVISWDNFGDVLATKGLHYKTVIIDELSGYKDRGSVRWKTMKKIITRPEVDYVWGLTGTPSPNGYMNLWAQIYLLDGGQRLGKNITTYRSRYFYPGRQIANGVVVEWILRPESEGHIKELIADIALAMETDGRVKLPKVTQNQIKIEMSPRTRKLYRDMKNDMVVDFRDVLGGEIHTAGNAAILSGKLSQISAGFLYVDDADIRGGKYQVIHKAKIDELKRIVGTVDSPVLVAYRYQAEREMILADPILGQLTHTIDEKGVIPAWNRGEVPVLLAHPASAGHGLNLQHGGHTIVWTSLDWDLELWEQFNKRLARQGQKHPVVIHLLMTNKSIDHFIYKTLMGKADVQADLLDYLESPV